MIRVMTIEDYDEVYKLWKKIRGFGIRSIDDSKEGVERFLRRNPTTSFVAVKVKSVRSASVIGFSSSVSVAIFRLLTGVFT